MCYYNPRQLGLLQITTPCYYNLRQPGYHNSRQRLLQFTTGATIHDRTYLLNAWPVLKHRRKNISLLYLPECHHNYSYNGYRNLFQQNCKTLYASFADLKRKKRNQYLFSKNVPHLTATENNFHCNTFQVNSSII